MEEATRKKEELKKERINLGKRLKRVLRKNPT